MQGTLIDLLFPICRAYNKNRIVSSKRFDYCSVSIIFITKYAKIVALQLYVC